MFADLCYFSVRSVQVFPPIVQGSMLLLQNRLIVDGNLQLLICCSLHLCFLFFHAFYWDIQGKLRFLWRTQLKISRSSFCPSQVRKTGLFATYCCTILKQNSHIIMKANFVLLVSRSFLIYIFQPCCRSGILASGIHSYFGCPNCQSCNDNCYFLNHKAGNSSWLFSTSQDYSHLQKVHGPNIHPGDELVLAGFLSGICNFIWKHK